MSDLPTDPTHLPIFGGSDEHGPSAVPSPAPAVTPPRRPGAYALAGPISRQDHRSAPVYVSSFAPTLVPPPPPPPADASRLPTDTQPIPVVPAAEARQTAIRAESRIDWKQVAFYRARASDQLTAALGDERGLDPEAERELGRTIIQELLQSANADNLFDGRTAWTEDEQFALAEATYNALFGLGRLQPYIDDDTVENIIITGAETVWLEKTDGTLLKADPVADNDQELLDFLAFVASRSEVNARAFSSANPRLHMRLDGGSRLAAAAWVTAHPSVVIRRHRLRRVNLEDMVELNMISDIQASFLRAAVRARKSIVVAGPQGAGKTTLVRALCAEINPWEAIGTFETEFELHLHELKDLHPIVHAWEARPGSGEIGADGRQAGEFTLDEALYDSFRFNLSRQIVGEVRGREIWAMIKAMESGAGSISTTHAATAEGALRKLVTCAMEAGSHITRDLATSKLAETVDLVVQIDLETIPLGGDRWRRSRWVSEIVHVAPGEAVKGYATTHVFRPSRDGGPAVPGVLTDDLRELERHGFDLGSYLAENGRQEVGR